MCDYSLDLVASRPAKVGDELVTTKFQNSMTRGFAAIGEPNVAVCLLPGTEVAFQKEVKYERFFTLFPDVKLGKKVARFRQINTGKPSVHHDGCRSLSNESCAKRREGSGLAHLRDAVGATCARIGDRRRQVRRVKGGSLSLRVNSWALLSEVLELGRWRAFARLPSALFLRPRRTRGIRQAAAGFCVH